MADQPKLEDESAPPYAPNYDQVQRNSLDWNDKHGDRAGVVEKDNDTALKPVAQSAAKAKKGQTTKRKSS